MSVVTLTYRQLTKEDNFFLVQYQEDDFLQVRGRGFLHTDEKVRNSRFFFYKKKKKKKWKHHSQCILGTKYWISKTKRWAKVNIISVYSPYTIF